MDQMSLLPLWDPNKSLLRGIVIRKTFLNTGSHLPVSRGLYELWYDAFNSKKDFLVIKLESMKVDAIVQEELSRRFMETFNTLAQDYCDDFYRKIVNVR